MRLNLREVSSVWQVMELLLQPWRKSFSGGCSGWGEVETGLNG